ncbi:isoprenylcysteine carboxylmethyltransferase family protein [Sphingomonas sp. JC676]|uniref:methyltransferase family protein n=1 Tax=Sphingomonas sp. JC676 TaxID=2768065 RepID=UPI001657C507|nr:isoprenylcysteine carboxylmethyltransferase family protein [Sphingomonas sp. JC676]MBC9032823.1 isoprenylcysteine carboxylmethyltransferase family protein [Sphingomonas sp. JC676]
MDTNREATRREISPPVAFIGTFIGGMILSGILGHPDLPLSGSFERTIGIAGMLLGAGLLFSAVRLFRDAGVDPWRGAPDLIADGVYGRSRNPMILGMGIIYLGAAIFADSMITLLLIAPLFFVLQNEVIEPEETDMQTRFGDRYRAYKEDVRRWI